MAAVQAAYVLMDREVTTSKVEEPVRSTAAAASSLIVLPRGVLAGSADLDRRGADLGRFTLAGAAP